MKYTIPQPATDLELAPGHGLFSIVVPEATVNFFENPSVEIDTSGFTASLSSIARTTAFQKRGIASLKIDPNGTGSLAGAYRTLAISANTAYCFSMDLLGSSGVTYSLMVKFSSTIIAKRKFVSTGKWQRIYMVFTSTNTGNHTFWIQSEQSTSKTYYTDGWQLEQKTYPTTYCDGDVKPYITDVDKPYKWSGARHASSSSRDADSRSGGREYSFENLGFKVIGYSGLGVPPIKNVTTDLYNGGSYYQDSVYLERNFTIVGAVFETSISRLGIKRAKIAQYVLPDMTKKKQPLLLRYRDNASDVYESPWEIRCFYDSGLEGSIDNNYQERIAINFIQTNPIITREGEYGASSGNLKLIPNSDAAQSAYKDASGIWNIMPLPGGSDTGTMNDIDALPDKTLVCAGDFTFSSVHYPCVRWNGTAHSVLAGTNNAEIGLKVVCLQNMTFYLLTSTHLYHWNGSGLSTILTANAGNFKSMALAPNGDLYIVGTFTTVNTSYSRSRIMSISGYSTAAQITSVGSTGANNTINDIVIEPNGNIYICGSFTSIEGVSANCVAYYNATSSTWKAFGSGANAQVNNLCANNGVIYGAGDGISLVNGIATYKFFKIQNGSIYPLDVTLSADPSGLGNIANKVWNYGPNKVALGAAGPLLVNNISISDIAIVSGNIFYPIDIKLLTAYSLSPWGNITTIKYLNGVTYVSQDAKAPMFQPEVAVINGYNNQPTFKVYGPCRLWRIDNYTTGKSIFFNGVKLEYGEVVELCFEKGNTYFRTSKPTYYSSLLRGYATETTDFSYAIAPGSNYDFDLVNGANNIGILITDNYLVNSKSGAASNINSISALFGVNSINSPLGQVVFTTIPSTGTTGSVTITNGSSNIAQTPPPWVDGADSYVKIIPMNSSNVYGLIYTNTLGGSATTWTANYLFDLGGIVLKETKRFLDGI